MLIMYFPFGVAIEKVPSGFVIPPEIFCVAVFFKTIVAYSRGWPEVASMTLPEIFISLVLFCEKRGVVNNKLQNRNSIFLVKTS